MGEEGFILNPWWGRMPFWLQCTSCWAKMWLLSPLRVLPCVLPAAARELLLIVKHSKSMVTQAFHSAFITTLWNRYCYLTKMKELTRVQSTECSVIQSCLTVYNHMDCSPRGSSVHGISQARILEWVAMPTPGDLPEPGIEPHLFHLLH